MVWVTFSTGPVGNGTVTLILNGGSASAWYDITVYDSRGPAILTSGTDGRYRVPGNCVLACGEGTASYSTPAYVSLDAPRSVTLSYNSGTIPTRGFVHVVASDTSAVPPSKMSLRLKDASQNWVTFTNGSTELFFGSGAGESHLAGQFTLLTSVTGVQTYTTVVTSHWSDGATRTAQGSAVVTVLNDADSPYGAGWRVSGLSRLYFSGQDVLMADGAGGIVLAPFSHCSGGTCFYTLPVWEYGQLSKRPSPGAGGILYDRSYPGGSVARFDTVGLLREIQDRWGNATAYTYDVSRRLTSITDPAGQTTTLAYRTSGAGGWKVGSIESITTPGGRASWFFVDAAGDLVRIDDPDGVTAFVATYDAQHSLLTHVGRRGDTWKLVYDFAGTVAADSMPPFNVLGTPLRLAARLRSLQADVLIDPASGQGTAPNPAPRRTPDSLRVEGTDPRGFTTSYAVNQLGLPARVKSPLGEVTVIDRADSYHVTRTITPSGDTLDITVEYPGNVRSVLHRNTGGRADYVYDTSQFYQLSRAYGNAIDSVWNYFGANGRLDSTRVGDASRKVTRFTYDARGRVVSVTDQNAHVTWSYPGTTGWMNTDSVRTGGRVVRYFFDSYGRTSKTIAAHGVSDSTAHDLLNRIASRHGPQGFAIRYTYGASSSVPDSVIDPRDQVYRSIATRWDGSNVKSIRSARKIALHSTRRAT